MDATTVGALTLSTDVVLAAGLVVVGGYAVIWCVKRGIAIFR
jgi:hypothetical protein